MFDLEAFRQQEFLRREANLKDAHWQELILCEAPSGPLHIVYVMTHVGVCGGTKIILEHANQLVQYGQKVSIVCHFDKPTWFPINPEVQYIKVPFDTELTFGIPPCHVIVATYWREIYECILRNIAPVVYFEQGDYHLFSWENVCERERNYIYAQFQTVPFIFTVSKGAADQIEANFRRKAEVIPNALNRSIFRPDFSKMDDGVMRVAMIGSEQNAFKRLTDIKQAVKLLKDRGRTVELLWISPEEPIEPMGTVAVNPPQNIIGDFYRKADVFVSASVYESFSLPVLEAMACGCAVLTTANKGVVSYAKDRKNCLFIEMNDPQDIADKIELLCSDKPLRKRIVKNALQTVGLYSWDFIIPRLLEYYRLIARFKPSD